MTSIRPSSRSFSSRSSRAGQATRLWTWYSSTRPWAWCSEASICRSARSSSAVQTLVATIASARRPSRARPRTRSASPYMGELSNRLAPTSSASSTIRRLVASAARPRTSNVREVPMPTTGTSKPFGPSVRRSIYRLAVLPLPKPEAYRARPARPPAGPAPGRADPGSAHADAAAEGQGGEGEGQGAEQRGGQEPLGDDGAVVAEQEAAGRLDNVGHGVDADRLLEPAGHQVPRQGARGQEQQREEDDEGGLGGPDRPGGQGDGDADRGEPDPEQQRQRQQPQRPDDRVGGEPDPDREPEQQQDHAVAEHGEHLAEQVADHQRGAVGRGERQLVPVAAGDVQDQGIAARGAGRREQDRDRELEGGVVADPELLLGHVAKGADLHHEEEHRDDQREDEQLGLAQDPADGPAGDGQDVGDQPGRGGQGLRLAGPASGHATGVRRDGAHRAPFRRRTATTLMTPSFRSRRARGPGPGRPRSPRRRRRRPCARRWRPGTRRPGSAATR